MMAKKMEEKKYDYAYVIEIITTVLISFIYYRIGWLLCGCRWCRFHCSEKFQSNLNLQQDLLDVFN